MFEVIEKTVPEPKWCTKLTRFGTIKGLLLKNITRFIKMWRLVPRINDIARKVVISGYEFLGPII